MRQRWMSSWLLGSPGRSVRVRLPGSVPTTASRDENKNLPPPLFDHHREILPRDLRWGAVGSAHVRLLELLGEPPVTPCRSRVHEVERNGPPSGLMSNSGSALKWVGLAPSVLLGDSPQPASNAASTAVKASAIRVMSLDRKIGSWSEADQLPCDVGHMTPPRSLPICSAEVTCPLSTLCAEAERCRGGSSRSLRPD